VFYTVVRHYDGREKKKRISLLGKTIWGDKKTGSNEGKFV
jgi:hypothetical protein